MLVVMLIQPLVPMPIWKPAATVPTRSGWRRGAKAAEESSAPATRLRWPGWAQASMKVRGETTRVYDRATRRRRPAGGAGERAEAPAAAAGVNVDARLAAVARVAVAVDGSRRCTSACGAAAARVAGGAVVYVAAEPARAAVELVGEGVDLAAVGGHRVAVGEAGVASSDAAGAGRAAWAVEAVQRLLHAPQLAMSPEGLVSQPLAALPSQLPKPGLQAPRAQAPPTQVGRRWGSCSGWRRRRSC